MTAAGEESFDPNAGRIQSIIAAGSFRGQIEDAAMMAGIADGMAGREPGEPRVAVVSPEIGDALRRLREIAVANGLARAYPFDVIRTSSPRRRDE